MQLNTKKHLKNNQNKDSPTRSPSPTSIHPTNDSVHFSKSPNKDKDTMRSPSPTSIPPTDIEVEPTKPDNHLSTPQQHSTNPKISFKHTPYQSDHQETKNNPPVASNPSEPEKTSSSILNNQQTSTTSITIPRRVIGLLIGKKAKRYTKYLNQPQQS